MKRWVLFLDSEAREFWAASGDDCYIAIRSESRSCVAGYQLAE